MESYKVLKDLNIDSEVEIAMVDSPKHMLSKIYKKDDI